MEKSKPELSYFKHWLLRAWLYAPTALVGSTLMALVITNIHHFVAALVMAISLFFLSLFLMSKVKTLEFKYESAELLIKMRNFGGGLMLPVLIKDALNMASGSRINVWTNIAIDIGFPVLCAPYWILFTRQKKPLKKGEIKL